MRTYATLLALLVLLSPLPASAENYPDTLGISLSALQKRTGNLKCAEADNPMSGGSSWLCQYKHYGGLDVNEEYLLSNAGHVSTVIVTTINLTPHGTVLAYLEEFTWAVRFYGAPRINIRSQPIRPKKLAAAVAKGAFAEISIWHIGKNNFLLLFLTGGEGEAAVTLFFTSRDGAAFLLKRMTDLENPYSVLLPDNGH